MLPHENTPWNDVKNITGQIEAIENNPILQKINSTIETAKKVVNDLKAEADKIIGTIATTENNLKNLTDKLNKEFQFPDIQNLVDSQIEQYKLIFAKKYDEVLSKIEIEPTKAIDFFVSDLVSKVEVIHKTYSDLNSEILNRVNKLHPKIQPIILKEYNKATLEFKKLWGNTFSEHRR